MNLIEGVELNIYSNNNEVLSIDLSSKQLIVLMKVLGLSLTNDGSLGFFSDETLDKLIKMQGNPLRLKEI